MCTTPKVGDTITAVTTPENATNVVSYQWYSGTDATQIVSPMEGETGKTLKVTASMVGQFFKVIATDDEGNIYESNATTAAVETTELALKSVEPGALTSGGYNVLIAYFNQPVKGLTAGDIQIRRVSNDRLYTVESVSLSSDAMTATMTLTNSNAAGADVQGLEAVVDYNLIVTLDGSTASKVFFIPGTASEVVVESVDVKNKSIEVGKPAIGTGGYSGVSYGTFTIPDTIKVDYNELLGETVSIKYDKNYAVSSINHEDETVVYGSFKGSTSGKNLTDMVTGKSYSIQESTSGSNYVSTIILRNNTPAWSAVAQMTNADMEDADTYAFGKVVLNSNGRIKTFVANKVWGANTAVADNTSNILVASKNGTSLINGKTEVDVKDYVILKDGKTITIDDIAEGDVVFYNSANKFAEVYTEKITGSLDNVYSGKFVVAGKTYDTAYTTLAGLVSQVRYPKTNGGLTAVDNTYLNQLKASGKDVNVYLSRTGQPVYLTGELGEAITSTKSLVITERPRFYDQNLVDYYRIKGSDGTTVSTYDIQIEKLQFIVDTNGQTIKVGYANQTKGGADPAADTTFKKFTRGTGTHTWGATTGAGAIAKDNAPTGEIVFCDGTTNTTATLVAKDYVTLTLDEAGTVIGLNFEDTGTAGAGVARTDATAFKSSLKVVDGLQIAQDCPIYIYNSTGATDAEVLSKTTLSAFTGEVAAANNGNIFVYSYDNKNVSAIVIDNSRGILAADVTGQVTQEVVVKSSKRNTETTTKLTELTVIYQGEEKTYTKFSTTAAAAASPADGAVLDIVINKDGETIETIGTEAAKSPVTTTVTVTSVDTQTFTLGADAGRQFSSTVAPTIVKFDETAGEYVVGAFSDLKAADTTQAAADQRQVKYSYLAGSTNYVDTIVILSAAETKKTTTRAAAITAITNANSKYTVAASAATTAAWAEYVEADTAADTAVAAYVAAGGTANNTNLTGYDTYYTTNKGHVANLATVKASVTAGKADSTTRRDKAAVDAQINALIGSTDDSVVKSARYTGTATTTNVVVTVTYIDGTTETVTFSDVTSVTGINDGDSITITA